MERIAGLHDRPGPDQAHHEIPEDQARKQQVDHVGETVHGIAGVMGANLLKKERHEADQRIDQGKPAENT